MFYGETTVKMYANAGIEETGQALIDQGYVFRGLDEDKRPVFGWQGNGLEDAVRATIKPLDDGVELVLRDHGGPVDQIFIDSLINSYVPGGVEFSRVN